MFVKMRNHRTMTLKLSRLEACDLLIAVAFLTGGQEAPKWIELYNKILDQIDKFDKELDKEGDDESDDQA